MLNLQQELHALEQELEREEKREFEYGLPVLLQARRFKKGRVEFFNKRRDIFEKIQKKLKEYGMFTSALSIALGVNVFGR